MKIIKRQQYLNKLIDVMDTPDIKVITGIRRAGKTELMESFVQYVNENIENANIIHINFRSTDFEELLDRKKLEKYIKNNYVADAYNLVCIDEVQLCKNFEIAINSLYTTKKYDIYLTGSNAFMLSSDLATLFTGTSISIPVYPFSFKEYLEYYEYQDLDEAFESFLIDGGMSGSYLYKNEGKYNYIKDVYNTIIERDLMKRKKVRNPYILKETANFLMSNIGNITSIRNITKKFNNNETTVSNKTVGNYTQYLCEAFVFYMFPTYDVKGLKYISSSNKYYLADHSFKYALLGRKDMDYGHVYENIVAMELLRRGYEVYVGKLYKKEIDFIATRRDEKIYIQVSDDISNQNTFKREVGPLLSINDAYPKMVIARTKHEETIHEGIRIVDISRWLTRQ